MLQGAARQAEACARRLRLPMRSRVWRGAAGELAGAGVGASMDFQDHRPYFPGDDPRHINWQAYARTGHYTMKLYREEVRPTVDLLWDVSPSMFLDEEKSVRAVELMHFTFECARRATAALGVCLLNGQASVRLDPALVATHRWPEHRPGAAGEATRAPDLGGLHLRPRGLRVLVSDLLFPGDPAPILRALDRGHGTTIVLCPFSNTEAAPDWSGSCEFLDVESERREARQVDEGVLRRYRAAYEAHFRLWKEQAQRFHIPLARIPASGSLEAALTAGALPVEALETY